MDLGYRKLEISVNPENATEEVFKLLKELRPVWKRENATLKILGGGYLNTTIKLVYQDKDIQDGLVIRINGPILEKAGISRRGEIDFLRQLNSHGVGMPLLASFNNGIISQLLPGESLQCEGKLTRDINFACGKVAKLLAGLHHATPKDANLKTSDGYHSSVISIGKQSIKFIQGIKDPDSIKTFLQHIDLAEIERELDTLYKELESFNMPVVLSHNDIWAANMLYDQETDVLSIIDYEMAGYNYLPFDIASYLLFIEGEPPQLTERASQEFSRLFIKAYLEEKARLNGLPTTSVTDKDIEKHYIWTCKCMMLFHLFNIPFLFVIGHLQDKDNAFDEMSLRMNREYKEMKEEYSAFKIPE